VVEPPRVRTGQGSVALSKVEFRERFLARFFDPEFDAHRDALDEIVEVAWRAYHEDRKSPRTRAAGREFADPDQELPVEWLATRDAIRLAERRRRSAKTPSRVLLICAAARSDQSCPGEMSKTFRMTKWARGAIEAAGGFEVDLLDLSHLASEYGRVIYPCKSCVATAMPLCHWPCSCYPNHGQGQSGDWMNEIYPRWVAAHGVMIVTPVYWYQAPSTLKLMADRLVCADGGNPDPTTTDGKDPAKAKALELAGWPYPRHLAGRAFAVVVHGDAAGVENLRRMLVDWLTDMDLVPCAPQPGLDRYVGYYEPYATSHEALDRDVALRTEVENQALALVARVRQIRDGTYRRPDEDLARPRPK
jgi:multimeric flavodoxin WrbA